MKRLFGVTVALAISAAFLSSAQAAIKIEIAEVQNGFAYIKGNGPQLGAQITWDGNAVTTANKNNGGFSFNGPTPANCIGELRDGVSMINVQVLDCNSGCPPPFGPERLPRQVFEDGPALKADHAFSLNRLPSLAGSSCNVRVGAWDRLQKIGEWQIGDNSRVFQGGGRK
jgi:hypothetical protein